MSEKYIVRNERHSDFETVEKITREAFYNIYVPSCTEHYLVHIMRSHEDFIPELDFVIELNGEVIGNIMYTKATLTDEDGKYPAAMMVKELVCGTLDGHMWIYRDSPVMSFDAQEAERFDDTLEKMKKEYRPSQDEFYIMSHSFVEG